jgi:RimJ/RimL family protein N-acetyltransferase
MLGVRDIVTWRLVGPGDADGLQIYFRALSTRSRHNRFLGAISELPPDLLADFVEPGRGGATSVIATMPFDGCARIVGEARYAFHAETGRFEFGLSVDDRWRGRGIGAAMLDHLECRAARLGAARLFGDTLPANAAMIALARRAGFAVAGHPDDWKLLRLEKPVGIGPVALPCSRRPVAGVGSRAAEAASQAAAVSGP